MAWIPPEAPGSAEGAVATAPIHDLRENRANDQARFTRERIAQLTQRFGVRPRLTWYDRHVTAENQAEEARVNGRAGEPAG